MSDFYLRLFKKKKLKFSQQVKRCGEKPVAGFVSNETGSGCDTRLKFAPLLSKLGEILEIFFFF